MVRHVRDPTGRFEQRPYWLEAELDKECERLLLAFLRRLHGKVDYPISTDDLKTLIEEEARDLDQYADLSAYGADVEGVSRPSTFRTTDADVRRACGVKRWRSSPG